MLELSRLYRDSLGLSQSISSSPAVYGLQPTSAAVLPVYSAALAHAAYDGLSRPAAASSAADPTSQGMDAGALPRAYGAVASQRLPYDPNYDPSTALMGGATAGVTSSGLPLHHPGAATAADPRKMVDPAFLGYLRSEGLAESTITLLLQHGFDSLPPLAMMEEHDVRSVAPNLAQARILSRVVLACRGSSPAGGRARSNSFSHRSDVYMQPQGLTMDPGLMQQPPGATAAAMQAVSPRMGLDFVGRRPSSAPSQHLLETTTYPAPRPLVTGTFPLSPGGYSGGSGTALVQTRPLPLYNAHSGLALSALGQPPSAIAAPPGTPGAAPKTFSGSYSPMELMKRAPALPPASPVAVHSPLHSPQLLRKGISAAVGATENSGLPVVSSSSLQPQNLNSTKLVGRRTGPPVIVSTMTTTPDPSNVPSHSPPLPRLAFSLFELKRHPARFDCAAINLDTLGDEKKKKTILVTD